MTQINLDDRPCHCFGARTRSVTVNSGHPVHVGWRCERCGATWRRCMAWAEGVLPAERDLEAEKQARVREELLERVQAERRELAGRQIEMTLVPAQRSFGAEGITRDVG